MTYIELLKQATLLYDQVLSRDLEASKVTCSQLLKDLNNKDKDN